MNKYRKTNFTLKLILFVSLLSISCSFSVTPVYNNKETKSGDVKDIKNRDDLKAKAMENVKLLHKLLEEQKFEEAYQMIDDNSALKNPKEKAMTGLQMLVDMYGKVEKMDLTKDNVVEDQSLNGGQLQLRQEFIVKFEKDTTAPKRYELFIWNVSPDNNLKLWSYLNSKD